MQANFTRFIILLLFPFLSSSLFAQGVLPGDNPWVDVKEEVFKKADQVRHIQPENYRTLLLDIDQLDQILDLAPARFTKSMAENAVTLELPNPDGKFSSFKIWYAPVLHPDLEAKYPGIRSFVGQGIDDPTASVRFDFTYKGFHAMWTSAEHKTILIDPYAEEDLNHYQVFYRGQNKKALEEPWSCGVEDHKADEKPDINSLQTKINGDCDLRTYRLALACTGEYAQFHGGTIPLTLSAMNTSMTRVNGVTEKDFTVTMQIIPNNDEIIFLNGSTDPYSNGNGGAMLSQNQTTCDNIIGTANYDIGHVFSTGGGGVASLDSPCKSNSKARGVTGQGAPIGDVFDIDYVAHEMGHQYGATHTQNNSCNRTNSSAFEPGSASTIMGYAGICSPNVQNNSDDHYHIHSIIQMVNYTVNGFGNSCPVITNTGNNPPNADAGFNYAIPASTPFVLEGTGTDPDGDGLTYCWEQYDNEVANMPPQPTNTVGPAFRSNSPTSSPDRFLPNLNDLVNNNSPTWEVLSSVSRSYTWKLTVRDNYQGAGCTDDDEMTVNVDGNSGPFLVTAPNVPTVWMAGTTETVTWNVAGTTGGSVNTPNVDIFLSTDGGFTYPVTLATNVPNDGSHDVTVPNNATSQARVMVRGSGNIFFDISNQNFTIQGAPEGFDLTVSPPAAIICQFEPFTYLVSIESEGGFNGPVSLSATGIPSGMNAVFAPNPVTAPGEANMILTNTGAVTPGNYVIEVTGSGASGTESQSVSLTILPGAPAQVQLLNPAPGAVSVPLSPIFGWTASAGATAYEIIISENQNLQDPVFTENNINNPVFQLPIMLEEETTYFWTVIPSNDCGEGQSSEPFSFTTLNDNPLEIMLSFTDVTCFGANDGTASVSAMGGSGMYTYLWNTGSEEPTISGLDPGTYSVTVDDGMNMADGTVTIGEPDEIILTAVITDANGGSDGAIDLEVSGGVGVITYNWSNGASTQDLESLTPGLYEVMVLDENECEASDAYFVGPESCDPWIPDGEETGSTTASIFSTAAPNAQLHRIRYREAGSMDAYSSSVAAASGSLDLTGLTPLTAYEYNTKTKCTDGSISDWSATTYFFTTLSEDEVCSDWEATSVEVDMTTAVITWSAQPGATLYRFAWRELMGGNWNKIDTDLTSITLENLTPGATYEYAGRTLCPDGFTPWSNVETFTTLPLMQLRETESISSSMLVELRPNPVNTELEIATNIETRAMVRIHNTTGQVVWEGQLNDPVQLIPTGDLPGGMYFLTVRTFDGKTQTERFIKAN